MSTGALSSETVDVALVIAHRLLDGATHDRQRGQTSGVGQYVAADFASLNAATVQQRIFASRAVNDHRQVPGEIAGVLKTGVHPLPTGGAVM